MIIGANHGSAIGTLVERSTRYCLLLHLPDGHGAEQVRDAMIETIATLPAHLWRSLTWDRGTELVKHREITVATGLPIYFCDPRSPWQRGSNENTNGLLRQYFPKGTDLAVHSVEHLAVVAVELNGRPCETLAWKTPAKALNQLLSEPSNTNGVASTACIRQNPSDAVGSTRRCVTRSQTQNTAGSSTRPTNGRSVRPHPIPGRPCALRPPTSPNPKYRSVWLTVVPILSRLCQCPASGCTTHSARGHQSRTRTTCS